MQKEIKIGIGVTLVAIGVGAALWKLGKPASPPVVAQEKTAPALGPRSGDSASPPPVGAFTNMQPTKRPPEQLKDETKAAAEKPAISIGPEVKREGVPRWPTGIDAVRSDTAESALRTAEPNLPGPAVLEPKAADGRAATGVPMSAIRSESITHLPTTHPAGRLAPASRPAANLPAGMKEHVVKPGDTFNALAAAYLGHSKYAGEIVKANPGVDPRKLRIGMVLKIPAAPAEPARTAAVAKPVAERTSTSALPPVPADRAYTVQPDENWAILAKRFLGDERAWPELYEANKDRVPGNNPNNLRPGTVIEIPRREDVPKR